MERKTLLHNNNNLNFNFEKIIETKIDEEELEIENS